MSQSQNELIQQSVKLPESDEDEIDLLGLIQTLGEEKWLLLGLPFLCACIAAVYSLSLTPIYTAKATFFFPPAKQASATAVLDELGIGGGLGRSSTDLYISFLQSNTVQDQIIAEYELIERYGAKNKEETRKTLSSLVKISLEKKSGLILIEAQDRSPEIAAKLANAYFKPFRAFLNRISHEEALQRKEFFAHQIEVIAQRPFRDPLIQATLLNSMIRQYEAARIDGAKEQQTIYPLDLAEIPEKKSSPKRARLVLTSGALALLATLAWIFIKIVVGSYNQNPVSAQKWSMMKNAWKLRS